MVEHTALGKSNEEQKKNWQASYAVKQLTWEAIKEQKSMVYCPVNPASG